MPQNQNFALGVGQGGVGLSIDTTGAGVGGKAGTITFAHFYRHHQKGLRDLA
jgi:hypothetical protein